ncbi:MAG: SiaB family protein kinase [Bacteroidales bacterium]
MALDIDKWYNELLDGDVIVHHKGTISGDYITQILDGIENELANRNEKSKVRKKVYNVMVEALQNLFHHTILKPEIIKTDTIDKNFAIFVLKKLPDGNFNLISGNFVEEPKVKFLKDRMDQINFLTLEELKILYQLILNNQEYSEKGGGGLGLIDIAKRTGHEFEYSFHNQNNGSYFFCLKIVITN